MRAVIRCEMSLSRKLASLLDLRSFIIVNLVFLECPMRVVVAWFMMTLLMVPMFTLVVTRMFRLPAARVLLCTLLMSLLRSDVGVLTLRLVVGTAYAARILSA